MPSRHLLAPTDRAPLLLFKESQPTIPADAMTPPAAPRRASEAASRGAEPAPTEVHVHIGRIEVIAPPEPGEAGEKSQRPAAQRTTARRIPCTTEALVSTALAIAGVTQVLRDLLNDRFINQNVAGDIGQSVTVSTMPPDKVVHRTASKPLQLNLFLRQVTPNLRLAQRRPAVARRGRARTAQQSTTRTQSALPDQRVRCRRFARRDPAGPCDAAAA